MYTDMSTTDIFNILSNDYLVPDIVLPTSTCIFILESPHVQEVIHRAPVAGSSGNTMSKHIFGAEYGRLPLGLLVKKNAETQANRPRLNGIGLVNVCNIPLQKAAYKKGLAFAGMDDWFTAMAYVRTNNQRDAFPNPQHMAIQDWLVTNFRTKLMLFQASPITFIPCGRFAQKFFRLADVHSPYWRIIENVPHPSYNSWDREQYQCQMNAIKEAVQMAAKSLIEEQ